MQLEELSKLQKELVQQILRPLQSLSKINLKKAEKLMDFNKALSKLPPGEALGIAISDWTNRTKAIVDAEIESRNLKFMRVLNDFIRELKESGVKAREFNRSWRLGLLEMVFRPETSQVQFAYNEEKVIGWKTVGDTEGLKALYANASEKLHNSEIPAQVFAESMREAYDFLRAHRGQSEQFNSQSVPAVDLVKELQVVLYRKAIERKTPKLKDTSKWVFLYNIDLYYANPNGASSEKRLLLEAGSQHEISKGKGILLNGLDAGQDYKFYCYFRA